MKSTFTTVFLSLLIALFVLLFVDSLFSYPNFSIANLTIVAIFSASLSFLILLQLKSPVNAIFFLFPFLFILSIPNLFRLWMLLALAVLLISQFHDGRIMRISLVSSLHLLAIAVVALIGFLVGSRSMYSLDKLIGTYFMPISIYVILVSLPKSNRIELLLPKLFVVAFSLIGLGSIIVKLLHPEMPRVSGFFFITPTVLAYGGSALLTISLYYLVSSKSKSVHYALFVLLLAAILLTNTRVAIPMVAVAILLYYRELHRFILPISILVLLVAFVGLEVFFQRFSDISYSKFDTSLAARLIAWKAGVEMLLESPWMGIGLADFADRYLELTAFPLIRLVHSHNSYLQKSLDIGIPGMLIFFSFIYSRLAIALWNSKDGLTRAIAWGLLIYLLGSMTDAVLFRTDWSLFFWILLACMERCRVNGAMPELSSPKIVMKTL